MRKTTRFVLSTFCASSRDTMRIGAKKAWKARQCRHTATCDVLSTDIFHSARLIEIVGRRLAEILTHFTPNNWLIGDNKFPRDEKLAEYFLRYLILALCLLSSKQMRFFCFAFVAFFLLSRRLLLECFSIHIVPKKCKINLENLSRLWRPAKTTTKLRRDDTKTNHERISNSREIALILTSNFFPYCFHSHRYPGLESVIYILLRAASHITPTTRGFR